MTGQAVGTLEQWLQEYLEETYGPVEDMHPEQIDEVRLAYFAGCASFVAYLMKTVVTERQIFSKRQFGNMLGEIDLYIHDLLKQTGGMQ
jgi:hypothetical protein